MNAIKIGIIGIALFWGLNASAQSADSKSEIVIPGWRIFTDYFLLLKYEGSWKIVQKSYTWRPWPKEADKK